MNYYVHSTDNNHVGPVSADLIARGVLAGRIPVGTYVARIGSSSWMPFEAVPEVTAALDAALMPNSTVQVAALPTPSVVPPPVVVEPVPGPSLLDQAVKGKPSSDEVPKKPVLDPRYKLLAVAVFGGFAAIGILETIASLILR